MIVVFVEGEREREGGSENMLTISQVDLHKKHILIFPFICSHALLSWHSIYAFCKYFHKEPFCWLKARGWCDEWEKGCCGKGDELRLTCANSKM